MTKRTHPHTFILQSEAMEGETVNLVKDFDGTTLHVLNEIESIPSFMVIFPDLSRAQGFPKTCIHGDLKIDIIVTFFDTTGKLHTTGIPEHLSENGYMLRIFERAMEESDHAYL